MRQIVLDTETTGLSPEAGHRIIEIGCLEMINRRLNGNHFHVYINPDREIEFAAEQVHGITNEFLQDKPHFTDIIDELIQFIQGAELIIHNAPFDVGFLNHEFKHAGKPSKKVSHYCTVFDTLSFARKKHPGKKNSLDALCKRYNVDNSGRELHGALLDAGLLADVYLAMTGGQVSLFSKENNTLQETKQTDNLANGDRVIKDLPIIKADKNELLAHKNQIEDIKNANNVQCLWESWENM